MLANPATQYFPFPKPQSSHNPKKEFTLQLSPVDLNSSLENNKSFIFKARIIEK